jgi:hypothetical protein
MPRSNTEGEDSTLTKEKRASNCSEVLRTNLGQFFVPGISSFRELSIWHPLQTPKVKVADLAKKLVN